MQTAAMKAQDATNELRYGGSKVPGDWYAVEAVDGLSLDLNSTSVADNAASAMGEAARGAFWEDARKTRKVEQQRAFREYQDEPAFHAADTKEKTAQAFLLREIFGNPIRPVTINPVWLTQTVLALAQAAYDNRNLPAGTLDNARLAVLADALEDAGCTNQDILNHCRQPGEHVRGCWVLDAILGKDGSP